MKAWLLLRWVANTAKLRGHTIRRSASDVSYELILGDGRWFRFPQDPREEETFAVEITDFPGTEKRTAFAESVPEKEFKQVSPGEFGNEFKGAFTFYKQVWAGDVDVLEDNDMVLGLKLGARRVYLLRRPEVEGEWRSFPGKPPGASRKEGFARGEGVALLTKEDEHHFRPGTDEKMEFIRTGDTWDLLHVPIATVGLWNGVSVSIDLLRKLVQNFQFLKDVLYVPLKIGHSSKFVENAKYEKTGEPALGWVKDLYVDEEKQYLRANFTKVPRAVVECIKKGAFTGMSIEIDPSFSGYGEVLVGVALLGADIPAMTSLPKLLAIYSREPGKTLTINFEGGGKMEETPKVEGLQKLSEVAPELLVVFQQQPEGQAENKDVSKLVELLKGKGYPTVLAEELLELMPEPNEEKVNLLPDYDRTLWGPRLETLEKRAKLPEKCESVIKELEEFQEQHKDELNDEEKAKIQAILEEAKKNLPHLEVEEKYGEYPKYPEAGGGHGEEAQAQGAKGETPQEKYPEEGPNVEVKELAKSGDAVFPPQDAGLMKKIEELTEAKAEMSRLKAELAKKSLEAVEARVQFYRQAGVPDEVLADLREALVQLDPNLTPSPDRIKLQQIIMRLVAGRPAASTFSRVTPVNTEPEPNLASVILAHSRKAKRCVETSN